MYMYILKVENNYNLRIIVNECSGISWSSPFYCPSLLHVLKENKQEWKNHLPYICPRDLVFPAKLASHKNYQIIVYIL